MALEDLDIFFNPREHADYVDYNGKTIISIFDEEEKHDADNIQRARLAVKVSDVAAPARYDEVVVSGVTWKVDNIASGDESVWNLNLMRDERPTI